MSQQLRPKFFIRYLHKKPTVVRLFKRGKKVEMKKGDVYLCDAEKALMLAKRYHGKFEVVEAHNLTDKEMAAVRKRVTAVEKATENAQKAAAKQRETMKLRDEVRKHLTTLYKNDMLSEEGYDESLQEVNEAGDDDLEEMLEIEGEKHLPVTLTRKMLEDNPELAEEGVKVGETLMIKESDLDEEDEPDCPNCVLGKTEEPHSNCPEADKLNKEAAKAKDDGKGEK